MTVSVNRSLFPTWASNFYRSPLWWDGREYSDVESAFQSAKTTDLHLRAEFAHGRPGGPGKAKQMGRNLRLRPDWEQVKDDVMLEILRAKFANAHLRQYLASYAEALVEWTSWHDNYWGVCLCGRPDCHGGMNRLGTLLEQVRGEIYGADPVPGHRVPFRALTVYGSPATPHSDMVAGRNDADWVRRFAGEA